MFHYNNIGGKIKGLAKFLFGIQVITIVIGGLILVAQGNDSFVTGLLIILFGPIIAWISSWFLYGFGQLIENSDIIANEHRNKTEPHQAEEVEDMVVYCPHCDAEVPCVEDTLTNKAEVTCPVCGAHFSIN